MSKEERTNLGFLAYTDKSGVIPSIRAHLQLLKNGDYLVIIRDGDIYSIQNSAAKLLATSKKDVEEAIKKGEIKREEVEEIERINKELGLCKPVLETIKVLRYKQTSKSVKPI